MNVFSSSAIAGVSPGPPEGGSPDASSPPSFGGGGGPVHVGACLAGMSVDAVLRGEGLDPASVRRRGARLVDAAERAIAQSAALLALRSVRGVHRVVGRGPDGLQLDGGGYLSGAFVARRLGDADRVVSVVCTLGGAIERSAAEQLQRDPLLGLALDGLGTAALMAHVECEHAAAGRLGSPDGGCAGDPVCPGVGGWPLDPGQREVFGLVDARSIGVTLLERAHMRPAKSLSFVIGIGGRPRRTASMCDDCEMAGRCQMAAPGRRAAQMDGLHPRRSECDLQ
jgi:hypothetical protein